MLVYFVVNPVTFSESESASLQGSARKGMLNCLSKSDNAADERDCHDNRARPSGVRLSRQLGVTNLVKGWPFTAVRALICRLNHTLNVAGLATG